MKMRPQTFVWRMRDKKDLMGLNRGRKVATFALPADYMVGRDGQLAWMEVKSTSDDVRFPYGNIEPGQRAAATVSASIGTPFWFVIYSVKLDRWFQLSAAEFIADIKAGKKSRRFEELTPCSLF